MLRVIKHKLVKTIRKVVHLKYEIKDIWNSYFSRSLTMRMTPYGFKLTGSKSIHHKGMQEGIFEPEETAIFKEIFQQVDVFVDVGANIGFYSCLAKHEGKHVVAVEPLSKNLEFLYLNLTENNWSDVEVYPLGLSDSPGLATLHGASSTGASLIENWAGSSKLFRRTIALSTLDILLGNRFKEEKKLIKIDVEGFEYQVLSGALKMISMDIKPIWVIEVCLNEYHPDGLSPHFEDIFNLFWEHGYEVRTADKNNILIERNDVKRWISSGSCDSGTINYIFKSTQA